MLGPTIGIVGAIILGQAAVTAGIVSPIAAIFGMIGVACGMLLLTVVLCSAKSLGVPYLAPVAPKTKPGYDIVLRGPVSSQELRPDELNPLNPIDRRRQSSISAMAKK